MASSMYLSMRKEIAGWLYDAVCTLTGQNLISAEEIFLGLSPSNYADISTSLAFRLSKSLKKNPDEIAKLLLSEIEDRLDASRYVQSASVLGPYINIQLSQDYCVAVIEKVLDERERYGGGVGKGRVVIEHTSTNPNGPLHVGHIRNSIIGDTLFRIHHRLGFDVETMYYVNDMGRQMAIVAWALRRLSFDSSKKPDHAIADAYIEANRELADNPSLECEITELMAVNERNDPEVRAEFERAVGLALTGIRQSLARMNVHIDTYVHESMFVDSGAVEKVAERLQQSGHTFVRDGALMVDLKSANIDKPLVIKRGDGTFLYTIRDIAYHIWKAEQCDRMIDVLGADHKLVSSQLRAVLDMLGEKKPEIVVFEFVSLPEGSMSTRTGKFVSADELLDRVVEHAQREVDVRRLDMGDEEKKAIAEAVGIGAVRYDVVKVSAEKDMVFDWKSALDFEKLGAPFIQYAHARACSILERAGERTEVGELSLLVEEPEQTLIKRTGQLTYVLDQCVRQLKPHHLAQYARELAEAFNQFYRLCPVLGAPPELMAPRLTLVRAARYGLAACLDTLGIQAIEEM
ncbi:MAG: arginine--tRNA ligase [Methermicoccaceae archaeon]